MKDDESVQKTGAGTTAAGAGQADAPDNASAGTAAAQLAAAGVETTHRQHKKHLPIRRKALKLF